MDLNKLLYEIKPLLMILVGVLALIQVSKQPLLFGASGLLLITVGSWTVASRLRYRGYFKSLKKDDSSN